MNDKDMLIFMALLKQAMEKEKKEEKENIENKFISWIRKVIGAEEEEENTAILEKVIAEQEEESSTHSEIRSLRGEFDALKEHLHRELAAIRGNLRVNVRRTDEALKAIEQVEDLGVELTRMHKEAEVWLGRDKATNDKVKAKKKR